MSLYLSSNFATIIRCSNGSLWAVGLGERDRNSNPIPLPVLSDFNCNLHTELATLDIPVEISEHTHMCKEYTRVMVNDPTRNCPFEVIIHNKEAYGREVEGVEAFVNECMAAANKETDSQPSDDSKRRSVGV